MAVQEGIMPTVSVIIPTYNRAQYVCETIDSVLAQTYRDFEIIVVDDGSTDNTREVLDRYSDNIRYVYRNNGGPAAARNTGLQHAQGRYNAFLDSDDVFLPWRLACHIPLFDDFPEAGIVCSKSTFFRGPWRTEGQDKLYRPNPRVELVDEFEDLLLWRKREMLMNTLTVRAKCFDRIGSFDESLPLAQDYDAWLRIAAHYPVVFADVTVGAVRMHSGQRDATKFPPGKLEDCYDHILDRIVDQIPPGRRTSHVFHLVEQRRALMKLQRGLGDLLREERAEEAVRYLGQEFARNSVLSDSLNNVEDHVAGIVMAYARGLDKADPAWPRAVALLQRVRKGIPPEYRHLRRKLGEFLALLHADRGFWFACEGGRLRSVGCGLQAVRYRPNMYMVRTLASICRKAAMHRGR